MRERQVGRGWHDLQGAGFDAAVSPIRGGVGDWYPAQARASRAAKRPGWLSLTQKTKSASCLCRYRACLRWVCRLSAVISIPAMFRVSHSMVREREFSGSELGVFAAHEPAVMVIRRQGRLLRGGAGPAISWEPFHLNDKESVVSNIVKFFLATRANALNALNSGPDPSLPVASFGNFDAEDALLEWESHLAGRPFEDLVQEDIPQVVAEIEEGPTVLVLSEALMGALVHAPATRIDDLAQWWVAEKEDGHIEISRSVALTILQAIVNLACQKRRSDESVYCWTS